jgi:hypothetical protein
MKSHMNKTTKALLILVTLMVVGVLATLWATSTFWLPPSPFGRRPLPRSVIPGDIEFFYTAQTVISTINLTLLIILLIIYIDIYQRTKSQFTIGLIIFSIVLFLHAVVSNPLVMRSFGFRAFGLGPFAMLPDLFTFIALIVLLYLSIKY